PLVRYVGEECDPLPQTKPIHLVLEFAPQLHFGIGADFPSSRQIEACFRSARCDVGKSIDQQVVSLVWCHATEGKDCFSLETDPRPYRLPFHLAHRVEAEFVVSGWYHRDSIE